MNSLETARHVDRMRACVRVRHLATIVTIHASASDARWAESLREVFRQVAPSVALVETKKTEVAGRGAQDSDVQEYTVPAFSASPTASC